MTALAVKKLTTKGRYAIGGGLFLNVSAPASRAWVFRYQHRHRDRLMTLGDAQHMSLAQARDAHTKAKAMLASGVDPLDQRREEAAPTPTVPSFVEAASQFIASHKAGWKNAVHRQQWPQTLQAYAYPVIGSMAVDSITANHILAIVEPMWSRTPETASRVRGRIEAVLSYCKARGWRSGENVAAWRDNLEHMLAPPSLRIFASPARPATNLPAPCCWATLFHLFKYECIDAHLSVAGKGGRLCRIDEPVSLFFDVSDHRCSSP
jgi:hypothetical protein